MASNIIKLENKSERDFRWPELEILAGDTVEIFKEQMERVPVIQKLIKAGELVVVEEKNEPDEDIKESSEEKEVKEVLKNIKGKKK